MRYIQRHSAFARTVHWAHTIACLSLFVTGILLFVPGIASSLSVGAMQVSRAVHRVAAVIFIGVPVLGIIFSPGGAKRFFAQLFAKWDDDDKEFMRKFLPYLFNPKKVHMPKQHEIKSGQRFADFFILGFALLMAFSGIFMWLAKFMDPGFIRWMYFVHDLSMIGLGVFLAGHIYLGSGIFQPYRGTIRLMFGDGKVSEADAMYHWGHWAEEELKKGDKVVEA
ncbi:MAG: cytochrome b/b6 domain-containing protein [Coriobacteriia bacterium]